MILELTKKNLQNAGYNEDEINRMLNAKEDCSLATSIASKQVFISKTENKFYTDIDYWRAWHFKRGTIIFPRLYPEFFEEYFNVTLNKFLEKQKNELNIYYDEKTQFDKFILLETNKSKEIINDNKIGSKAQQYTQWGGNNKTDRALEAYIQFLDNKLFVNQKTNTTKPGKKLGLNELALKLVYEGVKITRHNAKEYLTGTKHTSGDRLYLNFNHWSVVGNRKANVDPFTLTKLKNKIELFETVYELLPEEKKSTAKIEIEKLKSYLPKD